MNDAQRKQVERLRKNLPIIRKFAGWSMQDLADKLDVQKQTISNIEHTENRMSLSQYIAIRAIIEMEIQEHPENQALAVALKLLVDDESEEIDQDELQKTAGIVAVQASAGTDPKTLLKITESLLPAAALAINGILKTIPIIGAPILSPSISKILTLAKSQEEDNNHV